LRHINNNCSRSASTQEQDEHLAVAEIAEQLGAADSHTVLFFCSSRYDLPRLGEALRHRFTGNVLGCTSSGLVGPRGFQRGGITAVSLSQAAFHVESFLLKPLSECQGQVAAVAQTLNSRTPELSVAGKTFALLLVDGLSTKEEELVSALDQYLGRIPTVGGSAGDDLRLRETHVWFEGSFHTDAAVLAVVTTALPFQALQVHHFVPSERKLEITAASSKNRTILKINGETAALAYADLVDASMSDLNSNVFSRHPLLLERDGNYYVHSIQRVNGDGSLMMYSAIESGQQPCIGKPRDPLAVLDEVFRSLPAEVRDPSLVIGFDCVLRRLEFEQRRMDAAVGRFMADHNVIGFCTYGEQFNNRHVNQTFTGVAIKG
jgi:hypothetical protein